MMTNDVLGAKHAQPCVDDAQMWTTVYPPMRYVSGT